MHRSYSLRYYFRILSPTSLTCVKPCSSPSAEQMELMDIRHRHLLSLDWTDGIKKDSERIDRLEMYMGKMMEKRNGFCYYQIWLRMIWKHLSSPSPVYLVTRAIRRRKSGRLRRWEKKIMVIKQVVWLGKRNNNKKKLRNVYRWQELAVGLYKRK